MGKEIRKKKKINWCFLSINAILIILSIVSCVLAWLDEVKWKICWGDTNALGVLCQIITSTVFFVGSIIGIAIPLQKDGVFGISYSEFNKLRGPFKYSISVIIILLVVFSVLNAVFFALNFIFLCLGLSLISTIFCIYVTLVEVPLLMRKESRLLNVVKDRIRFQWATSADGSLPGEAFKVINYLIFSYSTLKSVYELLMGKDENYNREMLQTLLEVQEQQAFELSSIQDKERQLQIAEAIYVNLKDILYFNFDFTKQFKGEAKNNVYRVTRALFRLAEIPSYEKRATELLAEVITTIDYLETREKKEFIMAVALPMVSISVTSKDFLFAKAIRRKFSLFKYNLCENNALAVLFSVMSLHFYYLCNGAHDVEDDLKQKIREFIDYEGIDDNVRVDSWKSLLKIQLGDINFDVKQLVDYFNLNELNWDVHVQNFEAHFAVLTSSYILQWYLTCLFYSYVFGKIDFNALLIGDDELDYAIREVGSKIISESGKIFFTEEMKCMAEFYGLNIGSDENVALKIRESGFVEFVNNLHIEDLHKRQREAEGVNLDNLVKNYKEKVENSITAEFGYNSSIRIDDNPRYMNMLLEKRVDAWNYDGVIVETILNLISKEILRNTPLTVIERNEKFDEEMEKILELGMPLNITSAGYSCGFYINNSILRQEFDNAVKNASKISSKIFSGSYFVKEGGFSFNCEVVTMKVRELTPDQISKQADRYKRGDGQYVYDGAIISREELESIIGRMWYILSTGIRFKIIANKNMIFRIDLFSKPNKDYGTN